MTWTLLRNSLLVSALTALLAVVLGFLSALFVSGLEWRWRRWLIGAAILVLALPPFLVTSCWLHLLGLTGIWRTWLPLDIYSLGGTVWVLSLMFWPVSFLLVLGAWQRVERGHLDQEPSLSGTPLLRWLLLPMARNALAQSAIVTFVLALNNFAVPAILQVKVFPDEVWVNFNTTFDYAAAVRLSWPLVMAPLLLLFWLRRRDMAWPHLEGAVASGPFRRRLGAGWFRTGLVVGLATLGLSLGLPLADLGASSRTWRELLPSFLAGKAAVLNSLELAAVSATLVVLIALVTWRWPIGPITWIPFLLPGVLLGIALIYAFNRPVLSAFYESVGIVFLALSLRYLALGWNPVAQAMRSVDSDLADAARLEGASRWQRLRHVHWCQVALPVGAAWYLTYLFCLWDAETLILIMPPGAETLAVRVFNLLHYGHNAQVNALCLLLLMLAIAPLITFVAARSLKRLWDRRVALGMWALLCGIAGCSPAASPGEAPVQSHLFSRVKVIGSRGAGLGEFNKPRSVAVDAADNLYVVDMTGRVQKFSPDGAFLGFWQMPQTDKGKPKGMCLDEKGNVVVLEPHYSRVNHFTPEGKLVAQWGAHGTNAGELAFPRSVIVNSRGDIFVSEYGLTERVQQFASAGTRLLRVIGRGGTGPGEFNRAEGLGIDRQERLYVADSCNHRVQIFSPDGTFLSAFGRPGNGPGEMSYPYDVKVDAQGLQFVCEFGNSRIQIFDANHQPLEILGGPGAAPGKFSNPWGIALDSKGNLYVADAMNHRVQKFIRRRDDRAQAGPPVPGRRGVPEGQWSVAGRLRSRFKIHSCGRESALTSCDTSEKVRRRTSAATGTRISKQSPGPARIFSAAVVR
jgi:ABC-type Fe3+ transport system permease subunit/DNA-binding beta-propeller fold protein YncE